ncbi:nucleic acid-binding protein [Cristinia sonorae]|uniref:Nucleic acid-binding protein n=1 Tax=Cristinia sonorae TaxID=1940300 RepID=A0A8K0UU95_9AGAR|nr:nucleic acid-binding protein [Cristinia sonorae]
MNFLTRSGLRNVWRHHRFHPFSLESNLFRKMSSVAALAKLQDPLKALVTGSAEAGSPAYGQSEKDQAEVAEWIEKISAGEVVKPESLKDLESQLTSRTYLVSNYLTAADVALYGALHPILSQLQPPQYYSHPAITRYFDHIQNRASVRKTAESLSPAFSLVPFDLENAPKLERKADPPKEKKKPAVPAAEGAAAPAKKEKKDKKDKEAAAVSVEATEVKEEAAPAAGKAQKKEKKEKEKKPAAEKKAPAAEDAGEPVPSMIDLRVGKIVDIKVHPDADGLYIEQIDFGEETGPRTVVSGLVKYIPIDEMRDQYLVGVCNLKPANMRGVKSFAMVLCATHKDGKEAGIELVRPPAGSKPGERIYFEGAEFENATPLSQLNPKKKIFETVQPGFTTLETHEAAWVNPVTKSVHRIRTKDDVCKAPTYIGASLS